MIRYKTKDNQDHNSVNIFASKCNSSKIKDFIIIVLSIFLVLIGVAAIMHYRNYKRHVEQCQDVDYCNPKTNPRMLFGFGVIFGVIGLFYALFIVYQDYK